MLREYESLKPHVEHIHLHNTGINGGAGWIEEGAYGFRKFFTALARDHYAGSLAVEYCFVDGSTVERAQRAMRFCHVITTTKVNPAAILVLQ